MGVLGQACDGKGVGERSPRSPFQPSAQSPHVWSQQIEPPGEPPVQRVPSVVSVATVLSNLCVPSHPKKNTCF